jgi:hypothetical protein
MEHYVCKCQQAAYTFYVCGLNFLPWSGAPSSQKHRYLRVINIIGSFTLEKLTMLLLARIGNDSCKSITTWPAAVAQW